MISYREESEIKGDEYDAYIKDAREFIKVMKKFIEK